MSLPDDLTDEEVAELTDDLLSLKETLTAALEASKDGAKPICVRCQSDREQQ